jgi:hypothetical protein
MEEEPANNMSQIQHKEPEPNLIWKPCYYAKKNVVDTPKSVIYVGHQAGGMDDSNTLQFMVIGKSASCTPERYHNWKE